MQMTPITTISSSQRSKLIAAVSPSRSSPQCPPPHQSRRRLYHHINIPTYRGQWGNSPLGEGPKIGAWPKISSSPRSNILHKFTQIYEPEYQPNIRQSCNSNFDNQLSKKSVKFSVAGCVVLTLSAPKYDVSAGLCPDLPGVYSATPDLAGFKGMCENGWIANKK